MIIIYLSPEQQGLWYTFGSLAALSGLAELGFTLLISQLVSHEFSSLGLKSGYVIGKKHARDKLFSLIKFSLKMYFYIIPAACIILTVGGTYILIDQPPEIRFAWIIFSIVSAISLLVSNHLREGLHSEPISLGSTRRAIILENSNFFSFFIRKIKKKLSLIINQRESL